jgi:hypothetical protein
VSSTKATELTLTTFLTLDGVMQAPGGPTEDPSGDFAHGGWLVPHADSDMGAEMVEIFSKAGLSFWGAAPTISLQPTGPASQTPTIP